MITVRQLRTQYDRALELGWVNAAVRAAEGTKWTAAQLLAIASRETNLDPKYLKIAGDRGNGFGITQVDRRFFYDWVQSGKWKDAEECFKKTIIVLDESVKRINLCDRMGYITATTLAGKTYRTNAKKVEEGSADWLHIILSSYNCGVWSYYHYSKGRDIDTGTTGQDYGADVLGRANTIERWLTLNKVQPIPTPVPTPVPEPVVVPVQPEPKTYTFFELFKLILEWFKR